MNGLIDEIGFRVAALNWFVRATLLGSEDLVNELTEEGGALDRGGDPLVVSLRRPGEP